MHMDHVWARVVPAAGLPARAAPRSDSPVTWRLWQRADGGLNINQTDEESEDRTSAGVKVQSAASYTFLLAGQVPKQSMWLANDSWRSPLCRGDRDHAKEFNLANFATYKPHIALYDFVIHWNYFVSNYRLI